MSHLIVRKQGDGEGGGFTYSMGESSRWGTAGVPFLSNWGSVGVPLGSSWGRLYSMLFYKPRKLHICQSSVKGSSNQFMCKSKRKIQVF